MLNYSRQLASCSVTGALTQPLFGPVLQDSAASCSLMVPLSSGSILLTRQVANDVQLSAGYYHQGKLQFKDTPLPLAVMRRLDFRIAKTLGKSDKSKGGEVALVVQNALQDNYTEYSAYPQTQGKIFFNRRAYLTATFNF